MGTRTVTGTINHLDGTPWAAGVIKFTLLEPFETSTEVYPKESHSETLDASGEFSITLGVPDTGTAKYQITTPDNGNYTVYLASGAATDLQTLLVLAGTGVDQDAAQTIIDDLVIEMRSVDLASPTTTYVVTSANEYIRCNGTFTITLPAATGSGIVYLFKNIGTGVITIARAGTDLIDGAASQTLLYQYETMLLCDAAAGVWDII
jgi:hypothetical protein